MKDSHFQSLTKEEQDWLDSYLDGTITSEDFELLQNRLIEKPEFRRVLRRYLSLDSFLRGESELDLESSIGSATAPWLREANAKQQNIKSKVVRFQPWMLPALAALVILFLGLASLFSRNEGGAESVASKNEVVDSEQRQDEPFAEGFAVIKQVFDAKWNSEDHPYLEGYTLGSETLQLASGTIEVQFFSGALMTVEGPAEISLKSAWEAVCHEGAVRMSVPPAARGFKLQAPSSEIVDLGTEFGLSVRDGKEHVRVFDGEIALRNEKSNEHILEKGKAVELRSDGSHVELPNHKLSYPDTNQFRPQAARIQQKSFDEWLSFRSELVEDSRLLAYYSFEEATSAGLVPNLAGSHDSELDGAVILAEQVDGRWPGKKTALEFRRPGSRVRANIPGEFSALTFSTWVRIDSLDRWYNALFMSDSLQKGEPHWQIRDDGKMILSVLVDESRADPDTPGSKPGHFQYLYYSPVMWDRSMAGQWMHLASVFDPLNERVSHYVNGKRISQEQMKEKYIIETLRIGNAELGNWGQPFQEDPVFAIRNINGRMDEFALFQAALSDQEIAEIYERSRADKR